MKHPITHYDNPPAADLVIEYAALWKQDARWLANMPTGELRAAILDESRPFQARRLINSALKLIERSDTRQQRGRTFARTRRQQQTERATA